MTNKEDKTIALRFSASSGTYDQAAMVQPLVAEKIMEMLERSNPPGSILEIGCGTGMLTRQLAARFPDAQIDAVDISYKMIECARLRCVANGRIRWHVSDLRHFSPGGDYPLITSCSALHWIPPVSRIMKKISRLLAADGRLVFSLMSEGTLEELRQSRLRVAPGKPPIGKLPSVTEVSEALERAGLRILENTKERIVLSHPSATALLKSLHDQGVTGGSVSLAVAPLNRTELRKLIEDYDSSYRDHNGVYATYRAACFVAEKK